MSKEDYKYKDLTHKIIGCAMQVHSFLGNGFQEIIYQRALVIELRKIGLEFQRELELDLFYKDFPESIGTRRADFLIERKVLVELKALTNIEEVHRAQILNYMKAYRIEIGLLINFGEKSLNFKRFILNKTNLLNPFNKNQSNKSINLINL